MEWHYIKKDFSNMLGINVLFYIWSFSKDIARKFKNFPSEMSIVASTHVTPLEMSPFLTIVNDSDEIWKVYKYCKAVQFKKKKNISTKRKK